MHTHQHGFAQPMMAAAPSFDMNFADWLIGEVGRQVPMNQNIRPDVKPYFTSVLNYRADPNFTGNVERLVQFTTQRLQSLGVSPSGASAQHYQQAVADYIASRIPAVTNLANQAIQRQQAQQAQFMQGGMMAGMQPQQQMSGWGNFGQPQVQQPAGWGNYPQQPQQQMGWGGQPQAGGFGQPTPDVVYDALPDPAAPVQQPVPPVQPTPHPTGGWAPPPQQSSQADVFDTPNLKTTTVPPAAPSPVDTGAPRLNYRRVEIPGDMDDCIDHDLLFVADNVRHISDLGDTKAQTSVLKMRQRMNDLDQALREANEALPEEFHDGEYLHVVAFDQLHSLPVPTNEYSALIAKVRLAYEDKKDWRALLTVLDHTTHIYTKAVDRFITSQINRSLLRFFRCEENLASRIRIDNLDDLNDLMSGKFGQPQKNIPDWKAHLDRIMNQVIKTFFLDVDIMLPSDDDLSDIVRCEDNRMIVDGVSKYSLFQADDTLKKQYITAVFGQMTFIRTRREAIITNMLGKAQMETDDLNSEFAHTNNEKMFWTAYNLITRAHSCSEVDAVYVFGGPSWSLSPGSMKGARLTLFPNISTAEGVSSATRTHLVSHQMFYGDKKS